MTVGVGVAGVGRTRGRGSDGLVLRLSLCQGVLERGGALGQGIGDELQGRGQAQT